MGLKDWRVRRSLRDPVRGQFEVTGRYAAHPNGSSFREMLTGVVTGPGIATTAGEHLGDTDGRWVGRDVLPALIDRDDPSKFIVLWAEIPKPDFRAQARQQAQQAADAIRAGKTSRTSSAPHPDSQVFIAGQNPDEPTPAWATDMIADLTRQGLLPPDSAAGDHARPGTVHLPDQVLDLTAGRVSAAEAAQLIATGRLASAVLLTVADVPVPQAALPGPTASLCDLTLRLTRSDGSSYDATTRLGFRDAQRRAQIAVIGATLPVRVDPANETRVVVDSVTYDIQHPK
jgi:hypothetical protein